jgi:hypothetical protein
MYGWRRNDVDVGNAPVSEILLTFMAAGPVSAC